MVRRVMLSNGLNITIVKPIVITLANDLIKMLGVKSDTTVKYGDDYIINPSTTGRATMDDNTPSTLLEMTSKHLPVEGTDLSTIPFKSQTGSFYTDEETRTSAETVSKEMELVLSIKYKTKSETEANRIVSNIRLLTADASSFKKHKIALSYELPKTIKTFIHAVYNIKKTVYKDLDLEDFLTNTITKKIDRINSLDGKVSSGSYVLREQHENVVGYIVGDVGETSSNKENLYNTISLNYRITYFSPLAILINYPISFFNTTLPEPFIDFSYVEPINSSHFKDYEDAEEILAKQTTFGINYNGYYLKYPSFDEFKPMFEAVGYQAIMSVLILYDGSVDKPLMNINQLPGLTLKDSVRDLIIADKEHVGEKHESLFYIALYENDFINRRIKLYLDNDGNVYSPIKLDMTKTYRIFLYVTDSVNMLKCHTKKRTIDYLNNEIRVNQEKRETDRFEIGRIKESDRTHGEVVGVEQVERYDLLIDAYFSFFRVPDSVVTNTITSYPTVSPSDVLFKIQIPNYGWNKLSMYHHVNVFKMLKE